jgi:hypothetical protein
MHRIHPTLLIGALLGAAVLAGCGSDGASQPAPGTPENPLVARTPASSESSTGRSQSPGRSNEATAPKSKGSTAHGSGRSDGSSSSEGAQKQDYQRLLERQTKHPKSRFTPCNLVTQDQATAIIGSPIQQPLEAPQGPTCIYRTRDGKRFISLAVQSVKFSTVKRQVRRRQSVTISDRTGICGRYGQPMLYVPVSGGRVLTVAAPCGIAKQFALKAVPRLSG